MKEFIKALFDEDNKIPFQYKESDVDFYTEKFHSFYLLFFLKNEGELMNLWQETSEIFQELKNNREIYSADMDKNIVCIYCLEVSEDKYYQAEASGTISELSKKIAKIEEDLNYFTKHVFLYTPNMETFSEEQIGNFDSLCMRYIVNEEFDKYKKNSQDNYKYDFLINLFIKFPFLSFEKYQIRNRKEYRTVESFVQQEIEKKDIDLSVVQEEIVQLQKIIKNETEFFNWLDTLAEIQGDENL